MTGCKGDRREKGRKGRRGCGRDEERGSGGEGEG